MAHVDLPHLPEMRYSERQCLIAIDCPKAMLLVERCPCGADVVRPWEQSLIDLMTEEWGGCRKPDESIRKRILARCYEPPAPQRPGGRMACYSTRAAM